MRACGHRHAVLLRHAPISILLVCLGLATRVAAAAPEDHGDTALILAARRGDVAAVRKLLSQGVDVNEANKLGTTPLMSAAGAAGSLRAKWPGSPKVIRLLLARGAAANAQAAGGRTALMAAALAGDAESVRILLAAHADVNAAARRGETALTLAALGGFEEIVAELLDHGAEVNGGHDANGDTALMLAIRQAPFYAAVRAEEGASGETWQVLRIAWDSVREAFRYPAVTKWGVFERHLRIAGALLDHGADVNAVDRNGYTPLTLAATTGHGLFVRLLLDRGANVNAIARSFGESTALVIAVRVGNSSMVDAILEKHPDVDRKDAFGKSALDYAIQDERQDLVTALRWAGAR